MNHIGPTRRTDDPGPPTWREALDGFKHLRTISGDRVRAAMGMKQDIPPMAGIEYTKACETHSAADSDWKHWALMVRRYEAFVAIHPGMVDAKITEKCPHENACWTGDEAGFYRDPNAKPAVARYREPGDDDEEAAQ